MTSSTIKSLGEQWPQLCALQPIYSALVKEFVIEVPDSPVIDDNQSPSQEAVVQANNWLQQVDSQIQVHQLRQFLQTTTLANEAVLRDLLAHHLHKAVKASSDRDKIDFLLVQYFSLCAPSGLEDADLDLDYVPGEARPLVTGNGHPALALSNSFAFGGHNVALALRGAAR